MKRTNPFTHMTPRTVFALSIALAVATPWLFTGTAAAHGSKRPLRITSSLAGKKVLPHRIRWLAVPKLAAPKVKEVAFLIDGRTSWTEHAAPYSYGFDGNYLVTSWLAPGKHRFKVRVTATDGRRGTSRTVTAKVGPAAAPPREIAGRWTHVVTAAQPAGTWTLSVDKIGWSIGDPLGEGNLVDVAYLSPGSLEARGGIRTKPKVERNGTEGNGWCDEPFEPVRYTWAVQGDTLTLTLAGPARCNGQDQIWAGQWSRMR
jgi:hypothetical protein